ncbi:hypothetical protein D3Z47_13205 [Lachnospiraceae bacterium]|nr:hypothetical protein [Lachnospiraceae bacterium]
MCAIRLNISSSICINSVNVDRYVSLIWHKSPTKCGIHLPKSIFQTRSSPACGRSCCLSNIEGQGKYN